MVEISLKIAQIFHQTGRAEKAEQGLRFCVETQRRKVAEGERGQPPPARTCLKIAGTRFGHSATYRGGDLPLSTPCMKS